MNTTKIRAGVVGAAGLAAGKLLEILARHPQVEIHTCVSESSPGAPLSKSHPNLRAVLNMHFDTFDETKLAECDVVFSCKKGGESFAYIQKLMASRTRIIDFSGDYRLKSAEEFEKWYGLPHRHPDLLSKAVYGLPEWYREEIRDAKLLSNPGCYTTTSILACAPILASDLCENQPLVIDAISGVSGAGRGAKPENQYLSVSENVRAYRVGNHQHTPEIEQELGLIKSAWSGQQRPSHKNDAPHVPILFVPHVGPYKNGIMANCYIRAKKSVNVTPQLLHELLVAAYKDEPFVRVYEHGNLPQIEYVADTNFCDIGATYDPRTHTIVVISVTDNMIKGAAGQAVQNMNIMFGFDERAGLI